MENIKVKTETASAAGTGTFKPKFVPKAPVKKDVKVGESSEGGVAKSEEKTDLAASSSSNVKPKDKFNDRRNKRDDRNQDGGRGRGGGGRGNDRGGGNSAGRGQWVMPTGAAFFTGNASMALANKVKSVTIPVKQEAKPSRPNESIDPIISVDSNGIIKRASPVNLTGQDITSYNTYVQQQDDETDSDASVDEDGEENKVGGIDGMEVWPPKKYDSSAPLSLPFGPKTAAMRKLLATQPILADPSDPMALLNQEQLSLFLIQLPSDLRYNTLMKNSRSESPEIGGQESANSTTNSKAPKLLPNGKLGKLQLYKSGKVKLVTENGNSYDVNSGLTACFMQCIASVEVPPKDENDAAMNIKLEGEKKLKGQKPKDNIAVGKDGKLCFLGNVTKKLVITPDYELGIRRAHLPKSTNTSKVNLQQESEQPLEVEDMIEEEEDVGGAELYDDDT